ncbi:MAG: pilus assembly protein [Desulfarculus sp.]|nr:MAG: pilus assembly protein [Desulfarculus sp.]
MRSLLRLWRGRRGSVAVEFALFLPLLLILVFGVVELGAAWYSKQMLVNASREGARLGSLLNPDGFSDQDVVQHVQTLLQQAGFPGTVTVTSTGATNGAGALVTVQVDSPYQLPVLGALVPGVLSTVNLSATTVMRHE